jgi:hypothetical protein
MNHNCNILGCMNKAEYETQTTLEKKWFLWIRVCDDHIKDLEKAS